MTTTTSSPSTAIAVAKPVFTSAERLALAGFLAGYAGLTREAYALDLRQYTSWCQQRNIGLLQARRADIESFARDLEAGGRARATVTPWLYTIAGFYRYAVEEDLLEHSPAAHVRRPRLDYESHAMGLDRNELGAMLVAAGLGAAVPYGRAGHFSVRLGRARTGDLSAAPRKMQSTVAPRHKQGSPAATGVPSQRQRLRRGPRGAACRARELH